MIACLLVDYKPILITGSHRCGSTWLANMLDLSGNTLLAHEPFNIRPRSYALGGLARHWFTYAPELPQAAALEAFDRVLQRKTSKVFPRREAQHWLAPLRRGRLIVKDPIASLSSEWLAHNFDLEVIVLIRHPAAFAASLKRLGWDFPFEHFLEQELLMRDHLEPYRGELESPPEDIASQAALVWKCLYSVLLRYVERNPGWLAKTHEQLSYNPASELREMYEMFGLDWSAGAESQVEDHTRAGNPSAAPRGVVHQMKRDSAANTTSWKNILTETEAARVRESVREVSDRYYPEESWR